VNGSGGNGRDDCGCLGGRVEVAAVGGMAVELAAVEVAVVESVADLKDCCNWQYSFIFRSN